MVHKENTGTKTLNTAGGAGKKSSGGTSSIQDNNNDNNNRTTSKSSVNTSDNGYPKDYIRKIRELFPTWSDEDIISALTKADGDIEKAIEYIMGGVVTQEFGQWTEVKKTKVGEIKKKDDLNNRNNINNNNRKDENKVKLNSNKKDNQPIKSDDKSRKNRDFKIKPSNGDNQQQSSPNNTQKSQNVSKRPHTLNAQVQNTAPKQVEKVEPVQPPSQPLQSNNNTTTTTSTPELDKNVAYPNISAKSKMSDLLMEKERERSQTTKVHSPTQPQQNNNNSTSNTTANNTTTTTTTSTTTAQPTTTNIPVPVPASVPVPVSVPVTQPTTTVTPSTTPATNNTVTPQSYLAAVTAGSKPAAKPQTQQPVVVQPTPVVNVETPVTSTTSTTQQSTPAVPVTNNTANTTTTVPTQVNNTTPAIVAAVQPPTTVVATPNNTTPTPTSSQPVVTPVTTGAVQQQQPVRQSFGQKPGSTQAWKPKDSTTVSSVNRTPIGKQTSKNFDIPVALPDTVNYDPTFEVSIGKPSTSLESTTTPSSNNLVSIEPTTTQQPTNVVQPTATHHQNVVNNKPTVNTHQQPSQPQQPQQVQHQNSSTNINPIGLNNIMPQNNYQGFPPMMNQSVPMQSMNPMDGSHSLMPESDGLHHPYSYLQSPYMVPYQFFEDSDFRIRQQQQYYENNTPYHTHNNYQNRTTSPVNSANDQTNKGSFRNSSGNANPPYRANDGKFHPQENTNPQPQAANQPPSQSPPLPQQSSPFVPYQYYPTQLYYQQFQYPYYPSHKPYLPRGYPHPNQPGYAEEQDFKGQYGATNYFDQSQQSQQQQQQPQPQQQHQHQHQHQVQVQNQPGQPQQNKQQQQQPSQQLPQGNSPQLGSPTGQKTFNPDLSNQYKQYPYYNPGNFMPQTHFTNQTFQSHPSQRSNNF